MPSTSLLRTMTDGLTLRAISSEGPPASESVTAALVVRSLQLLRDIDPVFGVDLYQSVGDDLPARGDGRADTRLERSADQRASTAGGRAETADGLTDIMRRVGK